MKRRAYKLAFALPALTAATGCNAAGDADSIIVDTRPDACQSFGEPEHLVDVTLSKEGSADRLLRLDRRYLGLGDGAYSDAGMDHGNLVLLTAGPSLRVPQDQRQFVDEGHPLTIGMASPLSRVFEMKTRQSDNVASLSLSVLRHLEGAQAAVGSFAQRDLYYFAHPEGFREALVSCYRGGRVPSCEVTVSLEGLVASTGIPAEDIGDWKDTADRLGLFLSCAALN